MLEMLGKKVNQLSNTIAEQYNKLHIEPYLVAINWLLFIFSWLIYFHLVPGGIVSLIIISTLPLLGILLPSILSAVYRYFWGESSAASQDTNASTISIEHDNVHNACAKFTLHSFIHINILYCTLKTLAMCYGFSYVGVCSIVLTSIIALLMLPIVMKEATALTTILKNGGGSKAAKMNNKHSLNVNNFCISFFIAAAVSALVFAIMITSTIFLPVLFPAIYMPMLFITTLVTLDFLVLVTYLHYVRLQYGDENLNWSRVTMNILTFITATFGLLLTLFQASSKAGMFAGHNLIFTSIFSSVLGASGYMLFPTLIIFGLGITGILINDPMKGPSKNQTISVPPILALTKDDIGINSTDSFVPVLNRSRSTGDLHLLNNDHKDPDLLVKNSIP